MSLHWSLHFPTKSRAQAGGKIHIDRNKEYFSWQHSCQLRASNKTHVVHLENHMPPVHFRYAGILENTFR
jgi:hypothetical protein